MACTCGLVGTREQPRVLPYLAISVPVVGTIIVAILTRESAKDRSVVVESKGGVEAVVSSFSKIIEEERAARNEERLARVDCEEELAKVNRRLDGLEVREGSRHHTSKRSNPEARKRGTEKEH